MTKKKETKRQQNSNETTNEAVQGDRSSKIEQLFRLFPTKRYTLKDLAQASGGDDKQGQQQTNLAMMDLLDQGVVESVGSGKYRLVESPDAPMEGVLDMLASGSAYIKVEGQEQDVFVSARDTGYALNGDRVRFVINNIGRNGVPEGEVVEVVERANKKFVGVLDIDPGNNYGFLRADSRKMPIDIFVHFDEGHDYKNNQKVAVRITEWLPGSKSPAGEIVDVFGEVGDNNAEMHAILAEYDLPYKFDQQVVDAAEAISGAITKRDYAERRDMRGVPTFTIDPADAKDFDDALSIRKLSNGRWEIGVHIADVTHYVTPDTVVDTEAESRATSVYLVDRTVPMLPERLSNELCSLRPNEEKLAFSAIFEMDDQAKIHEQWLGRTVIMSIRRFSYEEAQSVIETGEGDYKEEVLTLDRLAKTLREQRFESGSISFERDEAKFTLDKDGKPTGVFFKEQKDSNHLIEEFMLLANRRVAEFIGKKRGQGANAERTFVYRVHDEPNVDKLGKFKDFIMRFGYNFRADGGRSVAKEMNKVMAAIKGKSEENVVSTLAIRTMAKAYYTTDNIGHYGLAFDYYSHFTSPIRRYPDMMVHRLLAQYLAGGKSAERSTYEALCEHSSEMEVRAAEAERASIKYKMVEFMIDRLGEEFDGHISGVTEWGIYVELDDTHIEGMVAMRDMVDDYYAFNEEDYAIKGRASGRVFTLGDGVRIKVLRADLARKQLDFQLTGSIDFKTGEVTPIAETQHGGEGSGRQGAGGGRGSSRRGVARAGASARGIAPSGGERRGKSSKSSRRKGASTESGGGSERGAEQQASSEGGRSKSGGRKISRKKSPLAKAKAAGKKRNKR